MQRQSYLFPTAPLTVQVRSEAPSPARLFLNANVVAGGTISPLKTAGDCTVNFTANYREIASFHNLLVQSVPQELS